MKNGSPTLSAAFVRTATQPGRYGDGRGSRGLYLRVHQTTNGRVSKSWAQQLRIGDKVTNLGLGPYPEVTLALAREKAIENSLKVAAGEDPRIPEATIPNFADAVEEVIAFHAEAWKNPKTAKRWRATLTTYAMPALGTKLVSEITTADVMSVLTPIWVAKPETGRKVRQRIGSVMKWAIAKGYREHNPAGDSLAAALPKVGQRAKHHPALPFAEVSDAINQVKGTDAWLATKLVLEFLTLTATRSGESRLASWDEVDLKSATWTIPASRTKNGLEHRVPLSRQAMGVLSTAQTLGGNSGMIFPSARGKALTDSTISKLLRENGIECVPHGMRSSFRDWCAECSDAPREIAEHALAHIEGSASELAYRRTDYFEHRRSLMQSWADYLQPCK